MNENDKKIKQTIASVFEPIKYTDFEKRLSFLSILGFSFVLIFAVFFPEILQAFRHYFGFLFAFSCFCLLAVDVSAGRRTGVIKMRNLVVKKQNQPIFFGLILITKFIGSICCLGLIWYFVRT